MAEYILQEASLALPDVFKDRTMNLFTLSDNGASEFTFVVSRASAKNEDKVHDAATRLVRELEITVPDFRLESSQMTSVDGLPAVELFYQFKNDNAIIFRGRPLFCSVTILAAKRWCVISVLARASLAIIIIINIRKLSAVLSSTNRLRLKPEKCSLPTARAIFCA
jgi:hypothetical protein